MRANTVSWIAALALVLATGCGSGPKKTINGSCETSADCSGGVCFADMCYTTCATPAECKPDEFCVVPAAATDLTICMAKSDFAGCQGDAECPSLVGSPCLRTLCDTEASLCDVANRSIGSDCETTGGNSGACNENGECVCTPSCQGRDCGGDGCGGICGLCANGATCMEGTCRGACVPDGSLSDGCDGKDNDCDGSTDEDFAVATTTCGVGACAAEGQRACQAGAEVDTCQPGQGAAEDALCDGVDEDCDGATDEDYQPVEITCGDFGCQRTGTTICEDGEVASSCTPGSPAGDDTVCNNIDDDCDGPIDEDFVPALTVCGVGACAASGQTTCVDGVAGDTCVPGTAALLDDTCDGADDDCDGVTDEDFVGGATVCGAGACASTGAVTCSGGQVADTCLPGVPAADDATCDGLDDDCDGSTDEDYAATEVACGVGACQAVGTTVCADGVETDSCSPSGAAGSDTVCNGIDDDCDEATDEDFVAADTTCGVGACGASGQTACVDGVEVDLCQPGVPATLDATCDGIDDDCNGLADDGFEATPSACGTGACAAVGELTCVAGSTNDSCAPGQPLATDDATCDAVDDDCDGTADDDFAPTPSACGLGACAAEGLVSCADGQLTDSCLPGEPGQGDASCDAVDDDCDGAIDEDYAPSPTTCGTGACAAAGELACQAGQVVDTCQAGSSALLDATCDGIDDDCDGATDEEYTPTATNCGVGACAAVGQLICTGGAELDVCDPGVAAADDADCDGVDDDCDGTNDEEYLPVPTTCGVGACAAAGQLVCQGGVAVDTCVQEQPAADDATCDGIDDDCDGATDEEYAPVTTACGVGACQAEGTTVCHGGVVSDSCSPGGAAGSDAVCNGIDDDCDGSTDEDYVVTATACGVGTCARTGQKTCSAGLEADSCTAGAPAASDATCNNLDDDCNGATDEDYVVTATACGVGTCARTGQKTCSAGLEADSCTAGTPAASDATCDGVDDDCNGAADEDYVVTATACGVGACARTGQKTCSAGQEANSCVAGTPAASDATCDGVDDDCSGSADEDYVATATACGVGACSRTGQLTCVTGALKDTCLAGTPAASDASCNGVDDDCNGATDEDYVVTATACGVGACVRSGQKTCVAGLVTDSCVAGTPAASDATCDGVDDDCNGTADEDYAVTSTACGVGACARTGQKTCTAGVVADSCAPGTPAASDATCNAVDDDCSGTADEDYVVTATACGVGACARTGQKTCTAGVVADSCVAGTPAASDATCNAVDDDCNGAIDEDYVVTATSCGVGVCARTGQKTCTAGVEADSCAPGTPGLEVCNGLDDDCNGKTDAADTAALTGNLFTYDQPSCEKTAGVCAAAKKTVAFCSAGAWRPCNASIYAYWAPTYQVTEGAACDGLDNDCDAATDEAYVPTATACGEGACAATGQIVCQGGTTHDTCTPGTPGGADTDCDAVDDNCNGQTDEGFVPVPSACGVGACLSTGQKTCANGQLVDSCVSGTPAASDATCDAIDDDCSGTADEDFVVTTTSCGVGACTRSGQRICTAGAISDTCAPGLPAINDATCDAIDDDCNGAADEDYVVTTTTCGVGACVRSGQKTCSVGREVDSCAPGAPGLEVCNGVDDDCNGKTDAADGARLLANDQPLCEKQDGVCQGTRKTAAFCVGGAWKPCNDTLYHFLATTYVSPEAPDCDGLDNDCDASVDEAYVASPTSCGTGVCASTGTTVCQGGVVGDTCTPREPAGTTDFLCDGLDQDCDGQTDEAPEADPACADGVGCSVDTCDPLVGLCDHAPDDTACDDGVACSVDTCDLTVGGCLNTPDDAACNDAVACTDDFCYVPPVAMPAPVGVPPILPVTGGPTAGCNHTPQHALCDDKNSCTTDACMSTGCVSTYQGDQTPCDDGDACTYADICGGGTCHGGAPVTCSDGDACTTDSCDPATGCFFPPVVCDDGIACTLDACNVDGCYFTPDDSLCADGDPCTTDQCVGGEGCSNLTYSCDDGIACTIDACDGTGGCTQTPDDAWCTTNDPANPVCALDMGCMPCDDTDGLLWDGCTAWSISEAALHSLTDLNEKKPDVTALPDGGFAVAWERSDGQGLVSQVKMRAFKANGTETMVEQLVNASSTGTHSGPRVVARDGASDLMLAWQRAYGSAAVITDYLMRAFTGTTGGTEIRVAGGTSTNQIVDWDVASAPKANTLVHVWTDFNPMAYTYAIRARMYDGAGNATTGVIEVLPQVGSSVNNHPRVAQWADGGFVVVWEDTNAAYTAGSGVVGRIYTPAGVAATSVFVIEDTGWFGQAVDPDVAVIDGSDTFVATWSRSHGTAPSTAGILLGQFSRTGEPVGGVAEVYPDYDAMALTPVVAADADGNIAVAWDIGPIYAATYKPGIDLPVPLSPAAQVNVHPYGSMSNPAIAKFADGSFIVVWDSCPGETTQDQQIGGSGCGIYGRKYSYDGVPLWLPVDRPIL